MTRVRLAALVTGFLLLAAFGLHRYVYFSTEAVFGLMAIIINWDGRRNRWSETFCNCCAISFALLYSYAASKSLLLASIIFSLLSLIQPVAGNAGWTAALSLLLATPLFDYFSNVFSFPVRIGLTDMAGRILSVTGTGFHAEGNTLLNGSTEFSVDPACMGLHMLGISLLTGIIIIGISQKNLRKRLSVAAVCGILLFLLLINIIANLFRIILLVQFRVPPEAPMHSLVGIACFIVYVLAPAGWLVRFFVRRFGKSAPENPKLPGATLSNAAVLRHSILLIFIAIVIFRTADKSANANLALGPVNAPGYSTEMLHDRIVKLTSDDALIYIKPIAGFYSADHQPGTCWTGSGYSFKKVEEKRLAGSLRYTAILEKDHAVLYSSWWYDSGISSTSSQLEWRWDAFRYSRNYALVNITSTTPEKLDSAIRNFIKINPCRAILSK